jgi:tRNA(Ile)-lysidine synthase
LVAVSGGADSVALLHALSRIGPEWGWRLIVGHVHHGLRPEADADASFVEGLAAALGCAIRLERVVVGRGRGVSPEAAARHARYAALGRMAAASGADRIAVGHTQDDQAETVLMRLAQGAGPRGMAGIPARRGRLVRPLLLVDRPAILGYLRAQGLTWVEDASNRDLRFLRNRVRHELLPLLSAHLGSGVSRALGRVAALAREGVVALEALVASRLPGRLRSVAGGAVLDLEALEGLPVAGAKELLRQAARAAWPDGPLRAGLRRPHVEALWRLRSAGPGARVRLPGGAFAERTRDGVWIGRRPTTWSALTLTVPGHLRLEAMGVELITDLVSPAGGRPVDPAWEAWFDPDTLPPGLVVRPRLPGERVVPFGTPGPVRVSRLLAAAGTPRLTRAGWPVLAAGPDDAIAWVIGVRRGTLAPVTASSTAMVRIRAVPIFATPGAQTLA